MNWSTATAPGTMIGSPAGRVDETTWEAFHGSLIAAITQAGDAGQAFILDLGGIDYMSSRGLRVLTLAMREAGARNVKLSLARPNERMREILAISRYDKIFDVLDDLPARD